MAGVYDPDRVFNADMDMLLHIVGQTKLVDQAYLEGNLPTIYTILNNLYMRLVPLMNEQEIQDVKSCIASCDEIFKRAIPNKPNNQLKPYLIPHLNKWNMIISRILVRAGIALGKHKKPKVLEFDIEEYDPNEEQDNKSL